MEGNSTRDLPNRDEREWWGEDYDCASRPYAGGGEAGHWQEGPEGPYQNPFFWLFALIGAFLFAMFLLATQAHAHGGLIACPVFKAEHRPILRGDLAEQNGLVEEAYDRGGSPDPDTWTYSSLLSTELEGGEVVLRHSPPTFYVVDENYDGLEDKVYVDVHGEGKCEDVLLYSDLTINHDRINDNRPSKGTVKEPQ